MAGLVVRKLGWLSETPTQFQDIFLSRCDLLVFDKQHPIYDAGDATGGIFGVAEGELELHLPIHGSASTLAHIGGPGFWAGDAAALSGNSRRITVVARASSFILRFSRAELARTVEQDPASLQYFTALLSRNLITAIDLIDALKREDPSQRLAATLVNLARATPRVPPAVRASQSELGSLARLSRSSVNAALADFEQRGWLRRRYGVIDITNLPALERLGNDEDFLSSAIERKFLAEGS